ncbi:MAG: fatty acid oxidation complex subunit alpha FadJ, partial [Gammaproteobacteria bacterium PRO9]|nr:fatty acid oxidation complex subunit alpha FadJ [Gammaproteobacteria bacterium PRO9]
MAELHGILGDIARRNLRGLVIHSGKASGFIAGADVNEFPKLDAEEPAYALVRQGQQVLDELAALPCPTVAVLNGFALGGGLELALACNRRIAVTSNDRGNDRGNDGGDERVFGLPEVQLGVHPGFGGTVRLPNLVGVRKAMDMLLTGRSLRPGEALAAGLIDAVVAEADWRTAAVNQVNAGRGRRPAPLLDRLLALKPVRP